MCMNYYELWIILYLVHMAGAKHQTVVNYIELTIIFNFIYIQLKFKEQDRSFKIRRKLFSFVHIKLCNLLENKS